MGADDRQEIFQRPGAEYRSIPFWSWNCKVTKELIDSQLDCFQEMGFGGVDIHPRIGLGTEYLGEEFMEMVRYTVEQCKERGLICWLYDDDRYPSGAADGIVTKDMRYRDRGLLLTQERQEGYCGDRESFETEIREGRKPKGYFAGAYALEFGDGLLLSYERLDGTDGECRVGNWTQEGMGDEATQGKAVRYAYVKLARESSSFEGQTYVDVLNPDAVAEFIRVTHDRYHETVGEEFGKTVRAIFTDEPRIGKQTQIAGADSRENFEIPYSEGFAEFFRERWGVELLDIVPELVWDMPGAGYLKRRWQYRDALCESFTSRFMDQICGWCGEHNILMTGHVLSETPLLAQAATVGECMRSYRRMDIPGIDVLCDDKCFVAAKQAVSVARQLGRQDCMSELYGVTGWDCTFKTYKLQGDWQAALGITKRVPHLSFMSMAGEAKRDWPASIFYQSPWYREFSYIEDHFARLNVMLTQGRPVVRVAVLHPIESVWLHMGQADRNGDAVKKLQDDLNRITEKLLFGTVDMDFLSEGLLPEQCGGVSDVLQVGRMEYETVILPPMDTVRSTTLDILERFRDQGGRILFLEKAPSLVDAEPSHRGRQLAERCEFVPMDGLLDALRQERDIQVLDPFGCPADNLFYQMREDECGKTLFLCHVWERERGEEHYTIRIRGLYGARQYQTQTGEVADVDAFYEEGDTCVEWHAYGQDSLLLRLEEKEVSPGLNRENGEEAGNTRQKAVWTEPTENRQDQGTHAQTGCLGGDCGCSGGDNGAYGFETVTTLRCPKEVFLKEKNVLLLDYARYSLDGGAVSEREEILKLDDRIRKEIGFEPRHEHMTQPYALEEKERHKLKLYYEVWAETQAEAMLAMELPEGCLVSLNGKASDMEVEGYYVDPAISVIRIPALKTGRNELTVELQYHQKTDLEAMYLLGDFAVEVRENAAVLKAWDGASGGNGCVSGVSRIKDERALSCSICLKDIELGDITTQGMPFYTGNLVYRFAFETEKAGYYAVRIPEWNGPVMAVYVDGRKAGRIAYAPYRAVLGELAEGSHELGVCLYGNRYNGFGPLHNADLKDKWIGPTAYRKKGKNWTDSYAIRPVGILSGIIVERRI